MTSNVKQKKITLNSGFPKRDWWDVPREPFQKLLVLSRPLAEAFESEVPWAAISFTDPDRPDAALSEVNRVGLLRQKFWDADKPQIYAPEHQLFNAADADEIWTFIDKVWDQIEVLIIHCEAGLCRSPACAAAIAKVKYGTDKFFTTNYYPNSLVLGTLNRAIS